MHNLALNSKGNSWRLSYIYVLLPDRSGLKPEMNIGYSVNMAKTDERQERAINSEKNGFNSRERG